MVYFPFLHDKEISSLENRGTIYFSRKTKKRRTPPPFFTIQEYLNEEEF
jgi:hypothetical protein